MVIFIDVGYRFRNCRKTSLIIERVCNPVSSSNIFPIEFSNQKEKHGFECPLLWEVIQNFQVSSRGFSYRIIINNKVVSGLSRFDYYNKK
jgi:hypothetical protein